MKDRTVGDRHLCVETVCGRERVRRAITGFGCGVGGDPLALLVAGFVLGWQARQGS